MWRECSEFRDHTVTHTMPQSTMKLSRKNVKHMLEVYHPYASLAVVISLVFCKAVGVSGVDKFFSVAYQTTKYDQVHHQKGWDDCYLVFFLLNIVTLIRFLHRKVVLEVSTLLRCQHLLIDLIANSQQVGHVCWAHC